MRTDFPATEIWLDATAMRCALSVGISSEAGTAALREVLTSALAEFPQAALDAEFMTDLHGGLARQRHDSMSAEAWTLWRHALQLYRKLNLLRSTQGLPELIDSVKEQWLSASVEWYETASGTTLNKPVRLVPTTGRPRDMVVTGVEISCEQDDIEGYAVLTSQVYRPPRTSPCQAFFPGARLLKLEWSDLPAGVGPVKRD